MIVAPSCASRTLGGSATHASSQISTPTTTSGASSTSTLLHEYHSPPKRSMPYSEAGEKCRAS